MGTNYTTKGYLSLDTDFDKLPAKLRQILDEQIGAPLPYNPRVFCLDADCKWHPECLGGIVAQLLENKIKVKLEAIVVSDYGEIEYCATAPDGTINCTGFQEITSLKRRIHEALRKPASLVAAEEKAKKAEQKKKLLAEKKKIDQQLKALR